MHRFAVYCEEDRVEPEDILCRQHEPGLVLTSSICSPSVVTRIQQESLPTGGAVRSAGFSSQSNGRQSDNLVSVCGVPELANRDVVFGRNVDSLVYLVVKCEVSA